MTRDAWQDRDFAAGWDEAGNLFTNPDRKVQLSLLADLVASSGATRLLDLGIGSAQVEAAIAQRHPTFFETCRVTGIDLSQAMLELAEDRCRQQAINEVRLFQQDFTSIADVELDAAPDAVICVQALHEVTHAVKQSVFRQVREWLPEGRRFYILDRFEYADDPWHDDWRGVWDWMRKGVSEDVLEFDDYHRRYSAKTDYIASVADYRDWLEAAGFDSICPYHCFNRALIIAH